MSYKKENKKFLKEYDLNKTIEEINSEVEWLIEKIKITEKRQMTIEQRLTSIAKTTDKILELQEKCQK